MLAKILSCALNGLDGYDLTVEVDVGIGLSAFELVGLPDASVRESRERVRAAVKNSGFDFPLRRITVNLAPADIRKEGPSLDLPIAVGILAATQQISIDEYLLSSAFIGELSLDGLVRPVSGALPIADHLSKSGNIKRLFLPEANAAEAAIVDGIEILPLHDLHQLTMHLSGEITVDPVHEDVRSLFSIQHDTYAVDFSDVRGQQPAKRALEVAVAGGHNVLMIGSPGSGKTMLARRLPTIMPELSLEESIECTKIYSISGNLPADTGLLTERPFRSPHHGASAVSIIGGGALPRPGEITLACHGVLFLDELPEFRRDVLEALRQPLEDRVVTVSRASGRADFPADFMLVAAMNPCPCGYFGDDQRECTCSPLQRRRYLSKLSGPLLDRIDLHINVPRVEYKALSSDTQEESSAAIKQRVLAARTVQSECFRGGKTRVNARMTRRELQKYCVLETDASLLLQDAFQSLKMSARAHDRVLKVSRTIADLAGSDKIQSVHLAEALQYRSLDREEI